LSRDAPLTSDRPYSIFVLVTIDAHLPCLIYIQQPHQARLCEVNQGWSLFLPVTCRERQPLPRELEQLWTYFVVKTNRLTTAL